MNRLTVKQVKEHCKKIGVYCRWIPETSEFVIGSRDGYYTTDYEDAIATANHISKQAK